MTRSTTDQKGLTMSKPTNPIVRTTQPRYLRGWLIREYADGMFDARQVDGVGLSPGFPSWREAFDWARAQEGQSAYARYQEGRRA